MNDPDEFEVDSSLTLLDGEAWIYDADSLNPTDDDAPDGVLAVLNRDGALFVLVKNGDSREWVNVEVRKRGVTRIQ